MNQQRILRKWGIVLVILLIILVNIMFIISQELNLSPSIIYSQSAYICYPYNLTNQTSLTDCLTYTIYGLDNPSELAEDFIYEEDLDIYWFNQGISLYFIFKNETYDLGYTNISYDEFIEKRNKISDWLDSVNYSEIEVLTITYPYDENIENLDSGEINTSLIYDLNGNLISDDNYDYFYNEFNQLEKVISSGNIIAEYYYDAEGNRIKKVENNETTYYIGDNFVRVVNNSGSFEEIYYYDNDKLIASNVSGEINYYHPDHLGSTTLITNSSGDLIEETFYLPFGEIISGGDSRYDYTGKELDNVGLMYYGARYYSSEIMKFTQADPVISEVYNPQDLNHYSYVRNNPYKYVDSEGKNPALVVGGIVITYAAVEMAIDITSLSYSSYSLYKNPESKVNQIAVSLDIIDLIGSPNPLPSGATFKFGEKVQNKLWKEFIENVGISALTEIEEYLKSEYKESQDISKEKEGGDETYSIKEKNLENEFLSDYSQRDYNQQGFYSNTGGTSPDGVIYSHGSRLIETVKITKIEPKHIGGVQRRMLTKYLRIWEDPKETFLITIVFIEFTLAGIVYLMIKITKNKKIRKTLKIILIILLSLGFLTAGLLRIISSSIK